MADKHEATIQDKFECEVKKPEAIQVPYAKVEMENLRMIDGVPTAVWRDGFEHNVAVTQGLLQMANVFFALTRVSTNGPFLFLHAATTASGNGWQQISGSVVNIQSCVSASFFPAPFSSSAWTTLSTSTTQDFQYTSATSTSISGAGFFFYTSASCGTGAASADIKLYDYGQFGATRTITQNDTLRVSATLSVGTA